MVDDQGLERKRRLLPGRKSRSREPSAERSGYDSSPEPNTKRHETDEHDDDPSNYQLKINLLYLRISEYDELQEILTLHLREGDAVCPAGIYELEVLTGSVMLFGNHYLSLKDPCLMHNLPECRFTLGTLIRCPLSSIKDKDLNKSVIRLRFKRFGPLAEKYLGDAVSDIKASIKALETSTRVDGYTVDIATCLEYSQVPKDYDGLALLLEKVELSNRLKLIADPSIPNYRLRPRLLICGEKDVGKSNCVRYLVNRLLNVYPYVFFIDCDCGQSEFTPHGFISLFKIVQPVFGAPWTHLSSPMLSFFIGGSTPSIQPAMYRRSAKLLSDKLDEISVE
ncbi:hypothetical protein ACOME3_001138 [Neoechinorhynchus agilis]